MCLRPGCVLRALRVCGDGLPIPEQGSPLPIRTRLAICSSSADAFTIQKLAGHEDVKISSRYIHPTSERMETVIGMLESKVDTEAYTGENGE